MAWAAYDEGALTRSGFHQSPVHQPLDGILMVLRDAVYFSHSFCSVGSCCSGANVQFDLLAEILGDLPVHGFGGHVHPPAALAFRLTVAQ